MTEGAASQTERRAVFLDRDGVINRKLPENAYVRDPSEFEFLPGAREALSIMRGLGFLLVITTNQRGIARGFMTDNDLEAVHGHMIAELQRNNIELDRVYYCPHDVHEQCGCRKPEPGMILAACNDLHVDVARSYMVGDSASDVAAGRKAGTRTVRIGQIADSDADMTFPDLLHFALFLKESLQESHCSTDSSSAQ